MRWDSRLRHLLYPGALLLCSVVAAWPAGAEPEAARPRLAFPVACTPGQDCWIFQYFDHDPGRGWRDYACGRRSYDGHTGTDIALRDEAAIAAGIPVLSAAAGTVRAVRDGMPDQLFGGDADGEVRGRECGNGVLIAHDGGWETQYCHLRKDSIRVQQGDRVTAGAVLGEIGLSGATEFPHLEFLVRYKGSPVDPFAGTRPDPACGLSPGHLWSEAALTKVTYSPVDILAVGFAPGAPDAASAHAGRLGAMVLPADSPALVAWATLAAVRAGDVLSLRLVAPDGGTVAESRSQIEADKIRYFAYAGRRARGAWPAGRYRALVRIERVGGEPGPVVREATAVLTVN